MYTTTAVSDRRFAAGDLQKSRYSVMIHEKVNWSRAEDLWQWLRVQKSGASISTMEEAGFPRSAILLLASKGGFSPVPADEGKTWRSYADFDSSPEAFALDNALQKGGLRRTNWLCKWHQSGEHPASSEVISRALGDENGQLNGTTRFVLGPLDRVAEVHFPPGELPVVAVYYEAKI